MIFALALAVAASTFAVSVEGATDCIVKDDVVAAVRARLAPDADIIPQQPPPDARLITVRVAQNEGGRSAVLVVAGVEGERSIGPLQTCAALSDATVVTLAVFLDSFRLAAAPPDLAAVPSPALRAPAPRAVAPLAVAPLAVVLAPRASLVSGTREARVLLGIGAGRGPSLGAHLEGGVAVEVGPAILGLRAGVDGSFTGVGAGAVTVIVVVLEPRLCVATGAGAVELCALVDAGVALPFGSGVADAKLGVVPVLSPGGSVELTVPLVRGVEVVVGVTIAVPILRLALRDTTTQAVLYQQPIVNGAVATGVRVPF